MARALKVLIADDNPTHRSMIQDMLESAGHSVVAAKDTGGAALKLEESVPDLLVLDLNMPGGGGELVTAKVGAKIPADLPIIFVTGVSPKVVAARVPRLPHVRVLYKPINAEDLYQAIDELVPAAS